MGMIGGLNPDDGGLVTQLSFLTTLLYYILYTLYYYVLNMTYRYTTEHPSSSRSLLILLSWRSFDPMCEKLRHAKQTWNLEKDGL